MFIYITVPEITGTSEYFDKKTIEFSEDLKLIAACTPE